MNRLSTRQRSAVRPASGQHVEFGRLRSASGAAPYSLFTPLHYEPNYAYPLIIWLHGPGDDESQLRRIIPVISMRNYVAVAPRGVAPDPQSAPTQRYYWPDDDGRLAQAEQAVAQCVERAGQRLRIHPQP